MAHGLTNYNSKQFFGLRQFMRRTGAQLAQLSSEEAGERTSKPLATQKPQKSAILDLRQLLSITGANWRKLAQQRGFAPLTIPPPKGGGLVRTGARPKSVCRTGARVAP